MVTIPKPRTPEGVKLNPADLAAGRYGTYEMVQNWGPEKTFEYSLLAQAEASSTLSEINPEIVPPAHAREISEKANLKCISPERIRENEEKTGHDVNGLNVSLGEVVKAEAASDINKLRTSADTTETAKALQVKGSLEIIADSVENLRDIVIDKSLEWIDTVDIEQTHNFDALPSVAGRAFAHYAEMLQSGLSLLKFVYLFSVKGKWGDATGNHHSATSSGVDGMKLQEAYCRKLGLGWMIASAQVPGREFDADVVYVLGRIGETIANIAQYVKTGKGDDRDIFIYLGKKKKGSSAMPHKDIKGGNPVNEEQTRSFRNYIRGTLVTAMANCQMDYARDLDNSANTRINFQDGFNFADHVIRSLASTVYSLGLRKERCRARIERSYGVVTSEQVLTRLTDRRYVPNPLTRKEADVLVGRLATAAYESKRQFADVLLEEPEITLRISSEDIKTLTDPFRFIGQSKEIIREIASRYHHQRTFEIENGDPEMQAVNIRLNLWNSLKKIADYEWKQGG
ncbi:Argininosuccinate lyase [uncultured archaeon]|nr:Argininosuccinate lyase [uncultured archaeon]